MNFRGSDTNVARTAGGSGSGIVVSTSMGSDAGCSGAVSCPLVNWSTRSPTFDSAFCTNSASPSSSEASSVSVSVFARLASGVSVVAPMSSSKGRFEASSGGKAKSRPSRPVGSCSCLIPEEQHG